MFRVSIYTFLATLMAATIAQADDSPSYNGFLSGEATSGITALPVDYMGLNAPATPSDPSIASTSPAPNTSGTAVHQTQPLGTYLQNADGTTVIRPVPPSDERSGVFYVVQRWQGERYFFQDISHCQLFVQSRQLQGNTVGKTEYYEINNGVVRTWHIVDVWSWRNTQQTASLNQAKQMAYGENRNGFQVQIIQFEMIEPSWWESQTVMSPRQYRSVVVPWF